MRFVTILSIVAISLSSTIWATSRGADLRRWEVAYVGDFSLAQKMMLLTPMKTYEDRLLNQFFMLYLYYRMGDAEKLSAVFYSIDEMIENDLICAPTLKTLP